MHKKNFARNRFFIGIGAILFFLSLYYIVVALSPKLRTPSLFYRNIIGSFISFFIPINMISWFVLGQTGGILILLFSCLSVVLIVLRYGVFYYNVYIFLFGISAFVGYRIFFNIKSFKNKCLARLETLEVERNTIASRVRQREKDIEVFQNRVQRYAALKDITEKLNSTLDLEQTARLIVEEAFRIIGRSERALLFLIDEAKQELGLFASKLVNELPPIKAKKDEIFGRWILRQRKSLIIEDLDNDFRFSAEALTDPEDRGFKSIIGAPIMTEKKVIGVLRMDSRRSSAYSQDDLRLLGIISDLAAVSVENCTLYQKTNELAIRDGLTGLYVQRYFKERLELELKRGLAGKRKFSILMVDLDHFKDCNDRYGHTVGDILLVKVAEMLKANAGEENVASRYGGEEFAILLFEIDKKGAIIIAEDMRKKVEEYVFNLRRHEVKITISIGISSFPDDSYLTEALVKKADDNLYRAKQEGRNRICPGSI